MIYRKAKEKLSEQAKEKNRKLVEKYGQSHEEAPDLGVLLGQSETYVEYTPDGKVKNYIKSQKILIMYRLKT